MELLTFSLSPTWLTPTSGVSQISTEIDSNGYTPFTLGMYDD